MSGRFITLEGSEGAGKSTNVDAVCETLTDAGIDFIRNPSGTPMAEALRDVMLHKWGESGGRHYRAFAGVCGAGSASRSRDSTRIGLWSGVVCDRFTDATFRLSGLWPSARFGKIGNIGIWIQGDLQPDITLYLDVAPDVARSVLPHRRKTA